MRISRTSTALALGLSALLATASPAGAVGGLTKAEARAIAIAGVVVGKDLPKDYFTPPRTAAELDPAAEAEFYKCLGGKRPSYQARTTGPKYLWAEKIGTPAAKSREIDSAADVTKTVEQARANQEAMRGAKGVSCYREGLIAGITRNLRATPKSVVVELVPATVAGADEAWAYKISFTVTSNNQDISGEGYVVGSRVGQALLRVTHTGSGQEFALDTVTTIAAKPVKRVKQATPASTSGKKTGRTAPPKA